jgi:Ca-activated chloride channel homolog
MLFQSPNMLWLLLAVPALVAAYVWFLRRRKKAAIRYSSVALVREGLGPGQRMRRHIPAALLLAGLTATILAVARPSAVIPSLSRQQTVVLAIDVSRSMRDIGGGLGDVR